MKLFNYSELHFSEVTSYKILTLEEHVFTYLELLATPYLDSCWCFAIKSDFKCQLKLETLFIFAKLCYFCLFFMENCATLCYWCRNRFVSRVVQNPLGSWMWILQVKIDLKGKLVICWNMDFIRSEVGTNEPLPVENIFPHFLAGLLSTHSYGRGHRWK